MGLLRGVGYVGLLLVACFIRVSLAGMECNAPCGDASNSKFARITTEGTALDAYVAKPDMVYGWGDTGRVLRGVLPFSTWTGHVLNMTSQRWLTSNDTSCSVWSHHLVVIVPGNLHYTGTALLFVSQGSNADPPPTAFDPFILMAAALAVKTHSMTAVLYQVPNQPCTFAADPDGRPRSEDALIAFTWRHFLDHTTEVEWPARLPMVKAAVRAMDTVQAYARRLLNNKVKNFAVVGASKRGWVTWLTAAVDKRVTCAVPIVMDLLNPPSNLAHFYQSLGGWPFTFGDYFDLNVTRDLDAPAMDKLWDIVDPYRYRERLTMPKLVVTTSQDEFFLIDDSRFFWDALPVEKHALILANTEHTLITSIAKLVCAIAAFHLSVMDSQGSRRGGWEAARTEAGTLSRQTESGRGERATSGARTESTEGVRDGFQPVLGGLEFAFEKSEISPGDLASASGTAAAAFGNRETTRVEPGSLNQAGLDGGKRALGRSETGQNLTAGRAKFIWGPRANEVGERVTSGVGVQERELEARDESEWDVYRLCGTPEGLQALHRPLLDAARPWQYRWLEGILGAFGGEDLARWQGRGTEETSENSPVLPSEAARDSTGSLREQNLAEIQPGNEQPGKMDARRHIEVDEETDGSAAGGVSLPLPFTPSDEAERARCKSQPQSREEEDWNRDCAKLVQAREGGVLQLWRQSKGTPLGSGPGRARPKYRYELHRAEGRIEIFCNNVPDIIVQWSAYTPPGNNRRDFRFVTRDYGNCSTLRFAGGCVQPFCFTPRVLKPSGSNLGDGLRYQATLPPPKRGYGAFFVEMRWRGLWDRPLYVFSTPALIVPDTYPFPDCRTAHGGPGCTGHLL